MEGSSEKENAEPRDETGCLGATTKRKFFATPVAKLNRSIVKGGGNRRVVSTKAAGNLSHTSILYKQSLKTNNRNLAKALDMCKQDTAALAKKVLDLEQEKQAQAAKISVLRKLTDQSSEAIEMEIQHRMKLRLEQLRRRIENAANLLHMAGDELQDVIIMCDHQKMKDIDEIVKDTLELTQMTTPDHLSLFRRMNKPKSVYPTIEEPVESTTSHVDVRNVLAVTDDTENRLSILNESAEMRRKSSLRQSLQAEDEYTSVSMETEDPAAPSRSKRRALRASQRLSAESMRPPEHVVRRSKRRTYTKSLNNGDEDKAVDVFKPLETVLSAANSKHSPSNHSLSKHSPKLVSSSDLTAGADVCSSVAPCTDDSLEKLVFNTKSSLMYTQMPYDEIPVGSKQTRDEALKQLQAAAASRSRRNTLVLNHKVPADELEQHLDSGVDKFFIRISPTKGLSNSKSDTEAETTLVAEAGPDTEAETTLVAEAGATVVTEIQCSGTGANDVGPLDEDDVSADEGAGSADEGDVSADEGNGSADEGVGPADEGVVPADEGVGSSTKSSEATGVQDPPARQMEILCKGGQFKVTVGNRDGGPARSKNKKKAKVHEQKDKKPSGLAQPKFKDPFELTFSETINDAAKTLNDFKEQQTVKKSTAPPASKEVMTELSDREISSPKSSALSADEIPSDPVVSTKMKKSKTTQRVKKATKPPKKSRKAASAEVAQTEQGDASDKKPAVSQVKKRKRKYKQEHEVDMSDDEAESKTRTRKQGKNRIGSSDDDEDTDWLPSGAKHESQKVASAGTKGQSLRSKGRIHFEQLNDLLSSDGESPPRIKHDAKPSQVQGRPGTSRRSVRPSRNVVRSEDEERLLDKRPENRHKKIKGSKVSESNVSSDGSIHSHSSIGEDRGCGSEEPIELAPDDARSQSKTQEVISSTLKAGSKNVKAMKNTSSRKGTNKRGKIAILLTDDDSNDDIMDKEVNSEEENEQSTRKRKKKAVGSTSKKVSVSSSKSVKKNVRRAAKSAAEPQLDNLKAKSNIESKFSDDYESISKVVVTSKPNRLTDTDNILLSDSDEELPPRVNARHRRAIVLNSPPVLSHSPATARTASGSQGKSLASTQDNGMESAEESEPVKPKTSPPKRSRRAAANINFKEPSLGGKLRRGDPGTSTVYRK